MSHFIEQSLYKAYYKIVVMVYIISRIFELERNCYELFSVDIIKPIMYVIIYMIQFMSRF